MREHTNQKGSEYGNFLCSVCHTRPNKVVCPLGRWLLPSTLTCEFKTHSAMNTQKSIKQVSINFHAPKSLLFQHNLHSLCNSKRVKANLSVQEI